MFSAFAVFRWAAWATRPSGADLVLPEPTEIEPACALRTADDAGLYTRDGLYLCPQP